ncbi:MaoC family dehydratase [Blastococcus sp. SYSU D00820]
MSVHPPETLQRAETEQLTRVQIARYAGAVDDFNPIHVDEEFARASGMPSVIAHGPLTVALALDLVVAQLGAEALTGLEARLTAPVFPGDRLALVPTEDGVQVEKQDGTVVATFVLGRSS